MMMCKYSHYFNLREMMRRFFIVNHNNYDSRTYFTTHPYIYCEYGTVIKGHALASCSSVGRYYRKNPASSSNVGNYCGHKHASNSIMGVIVGRKPASSSNMGSTRKQPPASSSNVGDIVGRKPTSSSNSDGVAFPQPRVAGEARYPGYAPPLTLLLCKSCD